MLGGLTSMTAVLGFIVIFAVLVLPLLVSYLWPLFEVLGLPAAYLPVINLPEADLPYRLPLPFLNIRRHRLGRLDFR